MITGFYAGILGLIMIALAFGVIRLRTKHKVALGDGGHPDLEKAVRAHGNFVENVPLAIIIMYILEASQIPEMALYAYGTILILARVLHAHSIYHSILKLRVFSMMASILLLAAGSVALIAMYIF